MRSAKLTAAVPALSGLAGFALFTFLFLAVDKQWEVAALAIAAVVALLALGRSGAAARIEAAAASHQRAALALTMAAVLLVALLLHGSHFALLMLATVA
ncbi:MAG: hypothetical protein ACREUQ_12675, partial [Burkholderiales bacterium]